MLIPRRQKVLVHVFLRKLQKVKADSKSWIAPWKQQLCDLLAVPLSAPWKVNIHLQNFCCLGSWLVHTRVNHLFQRNHSTLEIVIYNLSDTKEDVSQGRFTEDRDSKLEFPELGLKFSVKSSYV
jgi:hypothetical protein